MGKAIRVRRCFSCGAVLQTTNSKEKGFINKSIIENNKPDAILYCNRCYDKVKAINYSQLEDTVDNQIIKVLKDAVATDALIVWVVDLFTFNGSINLAIAKTIHKLNVVVVGTKRDLFSKSIPDSSFERYITESFKEAGINPYKVSIVGHESKIDGDKMFASLNEMRKGHDVYMIGTVYSGKTSIINKALKSFKNKSVWNISAEEYQGTKIKVLEIPLSNSSFFYELPGLGLETSLLSKLDNDSMKYIVPKKKVSISSRMLGKGDAIIVGNLVSFSLIKGKTTTVKLYSAEGVEVKKTKDDKITESFQEILRSRKLRPVCDNLLSFADYDMFDYEMENDNKVHDISINGLGWFSFVAKGQVIRIQLPKGVEIKEMLGKVR